MKLGDIRMEVPSVDSEIMLDDRKARSCEVVFIHPQWRFYTVEFTTGLGWKFRESYYFRDKRPDGPPLPEELQKTREALDARSRGPQGRHWKTNRAAAWRPMYS